MFTNIGKALGKVWDSVVAVSDVFNKIIMLPWNLAFKLYDWVYNET